MKSRAINFVIVLLFSLTGFFNQSSFAYSNLVLFEEGKQLSRLYKSMDIEHLWQSGKHVDWETGVADNPYATSGIKTHCSAFAAAACKKMGIYLLRPPEHSEILLASAQFDWLKSESAHNLGWRQISDPNLLNVYIKAQDYANKGMMVVASYKNINPYKPGHIAIVTPSNLSVEEVSKKGPKLIMSSNKNYSSIDFIDGFKRHIKSFPEKDILFFYNTKSYNFPKQYNENKLRK